MNLRKSDSFGHKTIFSSLNLAYYFLELVTKLSPTDEGSHEEGGGRRDTLIE
jgi:hypothetical protein